VIQLPTGTKIWIAAGVTVKLGMSTDEVKKSLGNPDKIVDLGAKQIYIYKDMKIVFIDSKVSDVQ
jgi:hypothetical protein